VKYAVDREYLVGLVQWHLAFTEETGYSPFEGVSDELYGLLVEFINRAGRTVLGAPLQRGVDPEEVELLEVVPHAIPGCSESA